MSRIKLLSFVAIVALLLGVSNAGAVSLDWNPGLNPTPWMWNSATTGIKWWSDPIATPSYFGSEDTAVFGLAGVGTVNVDSTTAVVVGGIKFNATGYTVQANVLGDQLTMGGASTSGNIDVGQLGPIGGSATISVPMVYGFGLFSTPVWTVHNAADSLLVTGEVNLSGLNNLKLDGAGVVTLGNVPTTTVLTPNGSATIISSGTGAKTVGGAIYQWSSMEVLTLDVADNLTISGNILGYGGSLVKLGAGTLTLSGDNFLNGASTISMTGANGTLLLGHDNALSGISGPTLDFNGGNVGAVGVRDIGNFWTATGNMNIVGTGTLKLSSGTPVWMNIGSPRTIDVASGATLQIAAQLNLGSNGLNLTGGGTVTLADIDSASGGSAIAVNGAGNYTFGGAILTTSSITPATLTLAGGGTTTLAGLNSGLGGTITVGATNTLRLGNDSALGTASLVFGGGNVVGIGGSRVIANNWSSTGAINTAGNLDFTAAGRTIAAGATLTASSGTTAFSGDNLNLAGSVSLQGAGGVALGATTPTNVTTTSGSYAITIGGAGLKEVRGNLTTAVPLTVNGAGSLLLRGSNAQSTSTVASGSTLVVSNNNALGSGKLTLAGGTLQVGAAGGITGMYYNQTPQNVGNANPDFNSLSALNALTNSLTPAVTAVSATGGNTQLQFQTIWSGQQGNIFHSQGFDSQFNYIVRYDGFLDVPVTGNYNFWTGSDDGNVLFLDGNDTPVVNNNFFQGYTERGTAAPVSLTAGRHAITIAMYQGGGDASFTVSSDLGGSKQFLSNAYLTLVDAPNFPTAFTSANAVDVTADAVVDLSYAPAGSTYALGALTPSANVSLAVNGANRTLNFASTALPTGSALTLAGTSHVGLGAVSGSVTTFNKTNTGNVSYSGTLSVGAGGLNLADGTLAGGTLSVAGPITFTGTKSATITGTAVNVTSGGGAIIVPNGSAPDDLTISAPLQAGAIALQKNGPGTLVLSGNSGATGGITVNDGTLKLAGTSPLGTGAVTLKNGTVLVPGTLLFTPGLSAGRLDGNAFNETGANPATSILLAVQGQGYGSSAASGGVWVDNSTWVYSGKMYFGNSTVSFAENVDDNVLIKVDGQQWLRDTNWGTPTTTGAKTVTPGWHDVEIRLGQGGGGAGGVNAGGEDYSVIGVGFDPLGNGVVTRANHIAVADPGDGSLLRVITGYTPVAGSSVTDIYVDGSATVDLTDASIGAPGSTVTFGNLIPSADAGLTVSGTGVTLQMTGTTLPGSGTLTLAGNSHVGLGAVTGSVAAFNKTTTGNVTYSGTLSVGSGGLSLVGGNLAGGTLNVAGPISYSGASSAVVSGTAVNLSSGAGVINVADGPAVNDLTISAPLQAGSIAIDKQGLGRLAILGSGGSTGGVTVNAGSLRLSGATPIGAGTAITLTNNSVLVPGVQTYTPGLREGRIQSANAGGLDYATANPANSVIRLSTRMGNTSTKDAAFVPNAASAQWWDNETWVYTGKFYDANGVCSFAASIDDSWSIRIDGVLYYSATNNNQWTTGILNLGMGALGDGWHDIDIRFANGTGGAGATHNGNGWIANAIGSGYNPNGSASSNYSDGYLPTVDPGDGSLFKTVGAFAPAGTSSNDVVVTGSATIDMIESEVVLTTATFRNLLPAAGTSLSVNGALGAVSFAGTTVPATGGFTVGGNGQLLFGQIGLAGATGTIDVLTTGSGFAQMSYNATPSSLGGLTVNVATGSRLSTLAGAADPAGGAHVNLANGAIFQVSSAAAGSVAVLPNLFLAGNATIEHSGIYTDTLGDATHGIAAGSGELTLNGLAGTLILGGNISGTPTIRKVGPGTMQLKGTLAAGTVAVNAGTFQLGASNRIADAIPVTVNSGGTFDLNGYVEAMSLLRVNSAGSVTTGSGWLFPAVLQMAGGTIDMRGGGTLVQPAGGISFVAGGANRAMILGGAIKTTGALAFHVADGPHPVDLTVSTLLTAPNSLTKDGAGTLFLSNRYNTFTGLGWDGPLAINGNGALGAASNVVALNGTKSLKYLNFMNPLMTPGIGASIVVPASRSITIDPTAGGTIDVSSDLGYWWGEDTNIVSYAGQITGAGKFVKTGAAGLELTNSALYANAPTSTQVQMGQLRLTSQNALGVATPTITVGHKGKLQLANAVAYDLSNVTMGGWSNPYAADSRPYGYNWAWYGSRLDVTGANMGSVATAKFPSTDIMGWLDLGTQGNAINAGDGTTSRVPRMGSWSMIRTGNNTVGMNVVLNGMTWLRTGGSTSSWDGVFSGTGGLIRIDSANINMRGANTFTGPLVINHAAGNNTWVVNGGTFATDNVQVWLGNFQLDDSGTTVIGQRLTNSAVNVQLMGGQFRYKGVNNVASTQTVPKTTLVGSPQITVERVGTGTPTFMLTTLDRPAGSTANFLAASGTLGTESFIKIGGGTSAMSTTAITPWAYVNNTDWAIYDTTNGVKAMNTYVAMPTSGGAGTENASVADAAVTTTGAVWINSLRLTGATATRAITLGGDLTLSSGGILAGVNAHNWDFLNTTGNSFKLVASDGLLTPTYKELVINYNSTGTNDANDFLRIQVPVSAAGLTLSNAKRVVLYGDTISGVAASDYHLGDIHVNAGTLYVRSPSAIGNSGTIYLAGGEIRPRDNAETAWTNNVVVTADSTIRPGYISANENLRHPMGDLTLAMGTRLNLYQENNHSLQFNNVNLAGGNYLNLDASTSTAAKPWQFAVGSGQTVTMGGPVFLNMWGAMSEWGQLDWHRTASVIDVPAVDRRWAVTGGSIMTLKTPAASDYSAAVDLHFGHVVVGADGALGNGSTTVNVWAPSTLEFSVAQTTYPMPTIMLDQYAVIGGQLGGDAGIFGGGANKITLPATDAIILKGSSVTPSVGTRGLAKDWLGVQGADMAAGVLTTVDPSSEIYRGVALLPNGTASVDPYFYGDLASTTGDLNVYMGGSTNRYATLRIRPSSPTAVQQINSASGAVNVYGPTELRWSGNGGNGPQGTFTTVNRIGTAETQNNWLLVFYDGVDSLRAGKTLNITDGRIGLVAGSQAAVNAGATVNILSNATLFLDGNVGERNPTTGTWNVASDGAVYLRRLDKLTGGATFNFAPGTLMIMRSDTADSSNIPLSAATFANQGDKLDYMIRANDDANDVFLGTGFLLGEGRRITTSHSTGARLGKRGTALGAGFGWAAGATNISITAAAGQTFQVNDAITVPSGKVLNVGDAGLFVTTTSEDTTHRLVAQDGAVEFDLLNLNAGGKINLVNGTMRLMPNVAGASFVLDGTIDDSIPKPLTFLGGGSLLQIQAGQNGVSTNYVSGTGTVVLGQGEDIEMLVDEIAAAPTVAAPAKMNVFQPRVLVLGTNETAVAAGVTGVLRSNRGADLAGNYGVARFSNVNLNANAVLGLAASVEDPVMADLVLLGDSVVRSQNGTAGRVLIGGIGTAAGDGFNRTVTLGANGTGFENPLDLVGPLSGKAYVVSNSASSTRLTRQSLDGGTTYFSTFNLGGRTLELRGVGNVDALVDPGAGSLIVNNGTLNHRYAYDTVGNPNTVVTLNAGTFNIDANRTVGSFIYNGGNFTYTAGMNLTMQYRLGGNGTIVDANAARLTLASGAGLAPGPDSKTPGTLTVGTAGSTATNLTLPADFKYDWKFGAAGADKVTVNGRLAFAGTTAGTVNVVPLDDSTPAGSYQILTWTGIDPATLPSSWTVNTALAPVPSPVVRWSGVDGAWGTPSNWTQIEYTGGTVADDGTATNGLDAGYFVLSGVTTQLAATPTITANSVVYLEPSFGSFTASGPAAAVTVKNLYVGKASTLDGIGTLNLTNAFTASESTAVRASGVLNVAGQFTTPLLASAGKTNFNSGAAPNVLTLSVTGDTTTFNSGAAGSISTVNVTAGTVAFNNGATTAVNNLNVKGGSASLNNASVKNLTVTGGGATVTGANAVVNAAAVSGGVVNTLADKLAVQTSLTLGSTNFSISGSPSFAVQGSDINAARTIAVSGGTLNVAGQWLSVGAASADIGGPGKAGSTTSSAGPNGAAFTVIGGGADIWAGNDQCQFVYQPVTGDFDVTVNLASELYTDGWLKAGLMARNSLAGNSAVADMVITPSNGVAFQWRVNDADAASVNSVTGGIAPPRKIRLQRVGNSFTAYYETTGGGSWTQQGTSQTLNVGSTMYLGLAATAHANNTLTTVNFDSAFDFNPVFNLPTTGFAVTQDSTLNAGSTSAALFGDLSLASSKLTLTGAPSYNFSSLSVSGATGVVGGKPVEVRGGTAAATWAAGSNLTLDGLTAQKVKFSATSGTVAVAAGTRPAVTIESGASLELTGTVSALRDSTAARFVDVINNSSVAGTGLRVTGITTQEVGAISGVGTTTVGDGTNAATLIADSIVQDTLVIGAGSSVVIPSSPRAAAASLLVGAESVVVPAGPVGAPAVSSGAPNAVPEPGTVALLLSLAVAGAAGCLVRRNRRSK